MICPYCAGWFKPGPMRKYKTAKEETASEQPRQTFLCTCTKSQGVWWDCEGSVHGKSQIEDVISLPAKE